MGISIDCFVSTKLGLASHQNAVPLLRQLTIANDGAEGLDDLILELEPSLPFAAAKTWRIDRLGPASSMAIPDRDIELKEGYLAELTESMQATVHLRLRSGTGVVAEQRFPIKLLARNQWGGVGSMPELLAAFCMPNDPAIDKVLKSTSNVLRRAGRPDGIDGYRAGSRQRVWELASAVWSAVCGYQISYVLPPASFEQEGQKIRPPSQVLDGSKYGRVYVNFAPAVSREALRAMRQTIRSWHLQLMCDKQIGDLSRMFNPVLRGWRNYYGRFHGSAMDTVWKHLDAYLVRWLQRKYKSLARHKTRAWEALRRLANAHSRAFVHWSLRYT